MKIESLTSRDLAAIHYLQPKGWPDIIPHIDFYTCSDFCYPVKVVKDGEIVGIGSAVLHQTTAWLAHIIVHPDYRNQGIGTLITQGLVESLKKTSAKTLLLIATKEGEPVYRKLGFSHVTDYLFFKDGNKAPLQSRNPSIVPYENQHQFEVIHLDRKVSGENRWLLLKPHLSEGVVYLDHQQLKGFYLPTLGEGLIVAYHQEAGVELMKFKHSKEIPKAVLPRENEAGINFLTSCGYQQYSKGSRMILGQEIDWLPDKIYSRIGGNFG